MNILAISATLISAIAAVVTTTAAIYAIKKARSTDFDERVMQAVKRSDFSGEVIALAQDKFSTQLHDRMQMFFQTSVTREEFLQFAAGYSKRLETLELNVSQLLSLTGSVSGKLDTLIELRNK